MPGRDPMKRSLHLATIGRVATTRRWIIGAAQLQDLSRCVFDHFLTGDEIGVAEPDLAPWREPEEFLRRIFEKVFTLDIEFTREGHATRPRGSVFRIIDRVQKLFLALGIVVDHNLERPLNAHPSRRFPIEDLPYMKFEVGEID